MRKLGFWLDLGLGPVGRDRWAWWGMGYSTLPEARMVRVRCGSDQTPGEQTSATLHPATDSSKRQACTRTLGAGPLGVCGLGHPPGCAQKGTCFV